MAELKITQTKSLIGGKPKQRATMQALGLRKIGHSVIRQDIPAVRGQIQQVAHLVSVEEV
ncbi:MAG: 50S ribosomal protein L30 [Bowdeniella nasicola]|nr:50S ribosomal protein L30 [Bowdeniella nasicola]